MTARSLECHGVTGHHIEYHHHHLARIKLNYPPPDPDQSNFQGVTWLSYQPPCYRNNNREARARATLSQHSTGRANKTRRHFSFFLHEATQFVDPLCTNLDPLSPFQGGINFNPSQVLTGRLSSLSGCHG